MTIFLTSFFFRKSAWLLRTSYAKSKKVEKSFTPQTCLRLECYLSGDIAQSFRLILCTF